MDIALIYFFSFSFSFVSTGAHGLGKYMKEAGF